MAEIKLNATEETLLIILCILLSLAIITVIVIAYKKKDDATRDKLWHNFIMIDSPDQMIALKNSESPSFDNRRPSTPLASMDKPQSPPPVYYQPPV